MLLPIWQHLNRDHFRTLTHRAVDGGATLVTLRRMVR